MHVGLDISFKTIYKYTFSHVTRPDLPKNVLFLELFHCNQTKEGVALLRYVHQLFQSWNDPRLSQSCSDFPPYQTLLQSFVSLLERVCEVLDLVKRTKNVVASSTNGIAYI